MKFQWISPLAITLAAAALGCPAQAADPVKPDIGSAHQIYQGALYPDQAVRTYSQTERVFSTRTVKAGGQPTPLPVSEMPLGKLTIPSNGNAYDLPDYVALNRMVGLLVMKDGKVVYEHYDFGFTPEMRWMSMSMAKSFVSTLVGAAIQDGHIGSVNDPVTKYLPQLKGSAYDGVSLRHMLTMTSGVGWNEDYADPKSNRRALLEMQIKGERAGAIFEVVKGLKRTAKPGTAFSYNTGETLLVGEVVRAATQMPLADYLSKKVWVPLGMEGDAAWWLDAPDGHEIGGSGLLARLRDFARFGQFILEGAKVNGQPIVPAGWLAEATSTKTLEGRRKEDIGYGYQWWPLGKESGRWHQGAFMADGIHGQYLYINPKQRVVVVGLGARSKPMGMEMVNDLDFIGAAVEKLAAR